MIWAWSIFILFVLAMLALDLGVFHRKAHVVHVKEALAWSGVWMALGLGFGGLVYAAYDAHWFGLGKSPDPADGVLLDGSGAMVKYLTGYVVEKSLSVDNIFVIVMIFGILAVPAIYQHRVLFWGILGALAMRGVMIALGAQLIARYHWILYIFGVFLILTAAKMLFVRAGHGNPADNATLRFLRRFLPLTGEHAEHFIVREAGRLLFTPLALALIMVEITDLIFAVDSIPAIFAITADPFLVFTSNVFAILGLRSLYFALGGLMSKFRYLKVSLAMVLLLVGGKMLAASWLKTLLGPNFSLWVLLAVLLILAAGVAASLLRPVNSSRRPATAM